MFYKNIYIYEMNKCVEENKKINNQFENIFQKQSIK